MKVPIDLSEFAQRAWLRPFESIQKEVGETSRQHMHHKHSFWKMSGGKTKARNNVFEYAKLRMPQSVVPSDSARTFGEKRL